MGKPFLPGANMSAELESLPAPKKRPEWAARLRGALATAMFIGVMSIFSPLDPTTWEGGRFGIVMMTIWAGGLLYWVLGIVRRHRSQFGLQLVMAAMVAVALFMAALRVLPPFVPVLFVFGVLSALMLRDSLRVSDSAAAFRTPQNRAIMGIAGAFGVAHFLRVMVLGPLLRW